MRIGIIGGPYFWKLWNTIPNKIDVNTPYGAPADSLFKGKINNHEIITLLRHGAKNNFNPTEVPYLANVYALGSLNLDFAIHVTLCGGLQDHYSNGDIFLFDQLIDHTKSRPNSFGRTLLKKEHHVNFGSPISENLLKLAHDIFLQNKINHHTGTMITEEGPRFSTAAESMMYKIWGAHAINQTSCPEVYLFRELEIPIVAMCLITNIVNKKSLIDTNEITKNVCLYRNVIPSAVKLFIEKLPNDLKIIPSQVDYFDVSSFDLR